MGNRVIQIVPTGLLVFLFLVVGIFLTAACTSAPEGSAPDGERWFAMQHCSGCHGERGTGGRAPVIQGAGLSYRAFSMKVRNSQSTIMPSYPADRLSDKELADIFAFLGE